MSSSRVARAGDVAAVLVQSPNFFGNFEDLEALGKLAHDAGALFVVAANPILLGIVEPPSAYGADIVVGEGQPLGNAMSFGGPGLGFFACAEKYVRQMPGRVVGRTVDVDGATAFVLTLSTREQHIRREKATSNICSNHALNALAACVYLSAVGQQGLAGIAALVRREGALPARARCSRPASSPRRGRRLRLRVHACLRGRCRRRCTRSCSMRGFLAGVSVEDVEAEWPTGVEGAENLVVFAVTEKRTKEEMDAFVEEVASL